MKRTKKKLTALQKHLKENGKKGGEALFAKVGSKGMRDLVRRRWDKKKTRPTTIKE